MTSLVDLRENIKSKWDSFLLDVRKRIFGPNNEKLDLLVDSFYKLEPTQRNSVIAGGIAVLVVVVFGFVALYFTQVNSLNRELNKRFDALYELRDLKRSYQTEDQKFTKLVDSVLSASGTLRIKPYFEKIANEQGVQLEGLTETKVPIPSDNPMSERLQEVKVKVRLNNISIPRLLNFVIEIEKGSGSIRVQDLQIRARYGTKLFFDVEVTGHGYIPLS
jgi:hypothetical protein